MVLMYRSQKSKIFILDLIFSLLDAPLDETLVKLMAPLVNHLVKGQFLSFQKQNKSSTIFMKNHEWMDIYKSTSILWRRHAASKHSLFLSQMFNCRWEGEQTVPGKSNVSLFLCACAFEPVSLLPCLEDLLCAGGRDVQEPPGCTGVQLLLVPTQRPHIHHPHHLPLDRCEERFRQKHCPDSWYHLFPITFTAHA